MIVLDASVLIAHLDANDLHHARAADVLMAAPDRPLAATVISIAEVLVGPARTGPLDLARQALERLAVRELAIDPGASRQLARFRADYRLRLPDCCVLLAADEHRAALASFDNRLIEVARSRGLETHGVLPTG